VLQDHVQTAFKYFQGRRLCNLPGQPVPVLSHSHSKKKLFPGVQMDPSVFQFVPIVQVLTGVTLSQKAKYKAASIILSNYPVILREWRK